MQLQKIRDCLEVALQSCSVEQKEMGHQVEQSVKFERSSFQRGNTLIFMNQSVNYNISANILNALRGLDQYLTEQQMAIPGDVSLPKEVEMLERRRVQEALEESNGNVSQAARLLGINRTTLQAKCGKYNIKHSPTQTLALEVVA